ncbi:MAG: GIY-YIG nuclease family protein [Candidatus Paceibacterota bacterium]
MYYAYVLESLKDRKFYVGYTENLKIRFESHSKGLVKSTKERRPLRLVYYKACLHQQDATRREKYLKCYYGKMFLRKRLKSYFDFYKRNEGKKD